jgi:ferredoxin, 2Fe-2S
VGKLPAKDAMEEHMLDFAFEPDATLSRLTCQVKVSAALNGLVVKLPERQI